jgi:hypothetical protein
MTRSAEEKLDAKFNSWFEERGQLERRLTVLTAAHHPTIKTVTMSK